MNNEQETEEIHRLREDLVSMNIQLKQLDEANQSWQQYQQNQLVLLRDRLKLTDVDNLSFEDIVQQIENHFNDLNNQLVELQDIKSNIFFFL
jgi:exonuclease VII small subunit